MSLLSVSNGSQATAVPLGRYSSGYLGRVSCGQTGTVVPSDEIPLKYHESGDCRSRRGRLG
jgi:hypothetical protein